MDDLINIMVLGNGFDVACGLPTNYSDFFKWRVKTHREDYKLLDDLILNNEHIEGFRFTHKIYGSYFYTNNVSEYGGSTKSTRGKLFQGFNLNFWDILFYTKFVIVNDDSPLNYENINKEIKWSEIEKDIFNFVNKNPDQRLHSTLSLRRFPTLDDLKNSELSQDYKLTDIQNKFVFYARQYFLETLKLNTYEDMYHKIDNSVILSELKNLKKNLQTISAFH